MIAVGVAFVVLTWAGRKRLRAWVVGLHGGQLIIALIPGLGGIGFYYAVLTNPDRGFISEIADSLGSLARTGPLGGVVVSVLAGILLYLPLLLVTMLWQWFGARKSVT